MAPTMLSLLKTHPVSLKENLQAIASTLGIDTTKNNTRAQLQSKIDQFLINEPDFEPKIRIFALD